MRNRFFYMLIPLALLLLTLAIIFPMKWNKTARGAEKKNPPDKTTMNRQTSHDGGEYIADGKKDNTNNKALKKDSDDERIRKLALKNKALAEENRKILEEAKTLQLEIAKKTSVEVEKSRRLYELIDKKQIWKYLSKAEKEYDALEKKHIDSIEFKDNKLKLKVSPFPEGMAIQKKLEQKFKDLLGAYYEDAMKVTPCSDAYRYYDSCLHETTIEITMVDGMQKYYMNKNGEKTECYIGYFGYGDQYGEYIKKYFEKPKDYNDMTAKVLGAFENQDYEAALQQCNSILQKYPDDNNSYYNLACSYARLGRSQEAFDSLMKSIEFGFHDAFHMLEDPDLASLREKNREEFNELLEKAEKQ